MERDVRSCILSLQGSPLDRFLLTGLLVAGVTVLLARSRLAGTWLRANGPIVAFFIYCAISTLWSEYPDVAFKRWTKAVGNLVKHGIDFADAATVLDDDRGMTVRDDAGSDEDRPSSSSSRARAFC